MADYEKTSKQIRSGEMLDPIEHAAIEASWGGPFIQDNSELLKKLGSKPISQIVKRQ